MKTYVYLAALLGFVSANPHAAKDATLVDLELSIKTLGIIKWQSFFDTYVQAIAPTTPSGYSSQTHACWFAWGIEQWATGIDERCALTVSQNCAAALISEFRFGLDMG